MVSGIATMISKYLSQMMVIPQNTTEMGTAVYAQMFNRIGWGAIIISVVLFSLIPFVKSLINNEDDVGNSNSSAKYA
jgi:dipeptide/tripeptide permease